jgi:hypothetical protein
MYAFTESFTGDSSEERENPYMAGADPGDATEQQNHQQECGDANSDQPQKPPAATATVNNSAPSRIKDRHRSFSLVILGRAHRRRKCLV